MPSKIAGLWKIISKHTVGTPEAGMRERITLNYKGRDIHLEGEGLFDLIEGNEKLSISIEPAKAKTTEPKETKSGG